MLRDLHRSEHISTNLGFPVGLFLFIIVRIMYPQKNWPTYKLAGSQKSHPHPPLNQNPTPWLEIGPVDTCELLISCHLHFRSPIDQTVRVFEVSQHTKFVLQNAVVFSCQSRLDRQGIRTGQQRQLRRVQLCISL